MIGSTSVRCRCPNGCERGCHRSRARLSPLAPGAGIPITSTADPGRRMARRDNDRERGRSRTRQRTPHAAVGMNPPPRGEGGGGFGRLYGGRGSRMAEGTRSSGRAHQHPPADGSSTDKKKVSLSSVRHIVRTLVWPRWMLLLLGLFLILINRLAGL